MLIVAGTFPIESLAIALSLPNGTQTEKKRATRCAAWVYQVAKARIRTNGPRLDEPRSCPCDLLKHDFSSKHHAQRNHGGSRVWCVTEVLCCRAPCLLSGKQNSQHSAKRLTESKPFGRFKNYALPTH